MSDNLTLLFPQVHKPWCQIALSSRLLRFYQVGADSCPHGFEWQHALFFSFCDFDMTRWAQCPLWCLSEMVRVAPSHCDFIQQVLFGPFILRASSLEANCRFAWVVDCRESSSDGKDPPSPFRLHKLHLVGHTQKKTVNSLLFLNLKNSCSHSNARPVSRHLMRLQTNSLCTWIKC